MKINCKFDSGNIKVLNSDNFDDIQLEINKDSNAETLQWFHFNLQNVKDKKCTLKIVNAGKCSYIEGWKNYEVCYSYDRKEWFRLKTEYDNGKLIINHQPKFSTVYYAYFTPYSFERHLDLISKTQMSMKLESKVIGNTVDGRSINLLKTKDNKDNKKNIWIIGRQHPGESMAEWFMEGLIESFINPENKIVTELIGKANFYFVPNMNLDGSYRGNLRSNAAGINLNREWLEPSIEKSPEVFYVRKEIFKTGCDLFLDIHGDEAIPYTFVAGSEGNQSYSEKQEKLEKEFVKSFMRISPDFQDKYGYEKEERGTANLGVASNFIGDKFDCLSFTLEMPFKDHNNNPDEKYGWSSERSKELGKSCLKVIQSLIDKI